MDVNETAKVAHRALDVNVTLNHRHPKESIVHYTQQSPVLKADKSTNNLAQIRVSRSLCVWKLGGVLSSLPDRKAVIPHKIPNRKCMQARRAPPRGRSPEIPGAPLHVFQMHSTSPLKQRHKSHGWEPGIWSGWRERERK